MEFTCHTICSPQVCGSVGVGVLLGLFNHYCQAKSFSSSPKHTPSAVTPQAPKYWLLPISPKQPLPHFYVVAHSGCFVQMEPCDISSNVHIGETGSDHWHRKGSTKVAWELVSHTKQNLAAWVLLASLTRMKTILSHRQDDPSQQQPGKRSLGQLWRTLSPFLHCKPNHLSNTLEFLSLWNVFNCSECNSGQWNYVSG